MSTRTSYCAIHERIERLEGEDVTVCFECGHVYEDNQEIVKEYANTFPNKPKTNIAHIDFCPLCLHDWIARPTS